MKHSGRSRALEYLAIHSLAWLVLGNLVGLWLATLLLKPELGQSLGALTYGRWMPLHLNIQLYGWCALPLVGLLFRLYLPEREAYEGAGPVLAITVWSTALAFGCWTWMNGRVTGKLFLDWSGPARTLLTFNFVFLAITLWVAFRDRCREEVSRRGASNGVVWVKGLLLAGLSTVPWVMWRATDPAGYQNINPESGGTTGANVLGSALGTVVLFFFLPWVLGLKSKGGSGASRWFGSKYIGGILVAHGLFFLWTGGRDAAHFEPAQALAVAGVLIWPPLLTIHLNRFSWSAAGKSWLKAAGAWASILVLSGLVAFLPGNFGGWKFTNALVAHAHMAMAGLLTSLCGLILRELVKGGPLDRLLSAALPFHLWHGGLALHITALVALGAVEATHPDVLFGPSTAAQIAYGVRWVAGFLMLLASISWLRHALGLAAEARAPSQNPMPQQTSGPDGVPVTVEPTWEVS